MGIFRPAMSVYQRVRFYNSAQEEMLLFKAEEGALWHLEEVDWTVDKAMQKWLGPRNQAGDLTWMSCWKSGSKVRINGL